MNLDPIFQDLRITEKAGKIYLTLLERGPSSIRKIADASGINRQTTFELLRTLIDRGLVTYYTERSRQAYVAEKPAVLIKLAEDEAGRLRSRVRELSEALPALEAMAGRAQAAATVRFYENLRGVKTVLEDVLTTMSRSTDRLYRAYSSERIAPILHDAYPKFTADRITKKIHVRVFGLGTHGAVHGLDERKMLTKNRAAPTYTLIYGHKVAMISLDSKGRPRCILIEDEAIAATHRLIFDTEWSTRS